MLFGQIAKGPAPAMGGPGPPDWFIIAILGAMGAVLLVAFAVQIFFLLTLSRALHRCHPDARVMDPSHVWFNLIPCFNLVWIFITVNRVADSLLNEFDDRNLDGGEDGGRGTGTAYAVMVICSNIPYLGALFGIVAFVLFIVYWVKIAGLSRILAEDAGGDGYYGDDDRGGGSDPRDDYDRGSPRDDDYTPYR